MVADTASTAGTDTADEPIHVDGNAHLKDLIAEHDIVLTDFYADWCGPCQMLEPVVETIAAVAKVDVDTNQQLAGSYGVQGHPTLILFANGEQVEEVVGVQGEEQLRSLIMLATYRFSTSSGVISADSFGSTSSTDFRNCRRSSPVS